MGYVGWICLVIILTYLECIAWLVPAERDKDLDNMFSVLAHWSGIKGKTDPFGNECLHIIIAYYLDDCHIINWPVRPN